MSDLKLDGVENRMKLVFDAKSVNEAFARMAVAGFIMELDPTMEELDDVKTAVSEAVTNAIIHGGAKEVEMECSYQGKELTVVVTDKGVGIENLSQAMEPFFTTKPEMERSGMGFAFMEAFMDKLEVWSKPAEGTRVTMIKELGGTND